MRRGAFAGRDGTVPPSHCCRRHPPTCVCPLATILLVCKAWTCTYTSSKRLSSFLLLLLNRRLPSGDEIDLNALPGALRARRDALECLHVYWDSAVAGGLSLAQLLESLQPLGALASLSLVLPGTAGGAVAAQHWGPLSTLARL